jgi:hypothetical protein
MKMADIWDRVLCVLAAPDWVTPAIALAQDAAHIGDNVTLVVQGRAGWSVTDVTRLMRDNGVEHWGGMYDIATDCIYISTTNADSGRAAEILRRNGILM